jgi:hypothetical protein
MKRLCAALLVPLAAACAATIGHEKVEGWPQLQIFEHYVPHAQMRNRCMRYVGFGTTPIACAEFSLAALRCDIWFSADFPPCRSRARWPRCARVARWATRRPGTAARPRNPSTMSCAAW